VGDSFSFLKRVMNKIGIISIILVLLISFFILYTPYCEIYYLSTDNIVEKQKLIDFIVRKPFNWLSSYPIAVIVFSPFILILISTFYNGKKTTILRVFFILFGLKIILCGVFTFDFLTSNGFHLMFSRKQNNFLFPYYFSIFYFLIIGGWYILLGISYFDSKKIINTPFEKLSLIKHLSTV